MFCVYGVSQTKCRKAAVKKVGALKGKLAPQNAEEREAQIAVVQAQIFKSSKPSSISGELAMPSSVNDFIIQAKKLPGEFRSLCGMRRRPVLDKKGNPILTKAKRQRYEWVPLEENFNPDIHI
ncbi:hypothetical protein [Pseudoalteromonas sp. R3]|uniref:hypothetical protein n=1 Tax=Pseudoalteromonas sp. R3 TaxID=1709477 RepID=UPI0006B613B5|nr:hypothetical protein [Pseudoalteromonas sp. R3]AZZ98789.1 hypothetical protein ELR70_17790 [Pseudoalteromonas sp. R3]